MRLSSLHHTILAFCILGLAFLGWPLLADSQGVSSSVSGWSFTQDRMHAGLVRIRISTVQYNPARPWSKEVGPTFDVTGLVRPGNRILLSAGPVRDAANIEVTRHGSYRKYQGQVILIDSEANLAMITVDDPEFFKGLEPIPFSRDPLLGQTYRAARIDSSFSIESTDVTVSELLPVADYGFTRLPVAIFRSAPRFESGGLILDGEGISGMIGFVDGQDQAEAVFASRLQHFEGMVDSVQSLPVQRKKEKYTGFPVQGFFYSPLEDPSLRKHYGLENSQDGILITTVLDGCSVTGKLQSGDVLTRVDGYSVNPAGDYKDPQLGWQPVDLLFVRDIKGALRRVGQELKLEIVRSGETKKITIKLQSYKGGAERIAWTEPEPPPYVVHEGLIFVELSVPFLKERFGAEWQNRALALAAVYDSSKYYKPGETKDRILVLSDVLPAESTRGFERLAGEQLMRIDDEKAQSLFQLKKALENSTDSIIVLEFRSGRKIYVRTGKGNPELRADYGIQEKSRMRKTIPGN
ncbi:MAG: hypothetical protein RH862_20040 [Leptospiraceae bacterium]